MRDESNRALFVGLERAGLLVTAMRFSAGEVTTAASLSQSTRSFRCFWARVVAPIQGGIVFFIFERMNDGFGG
jgi:hypothetical protein